MLREHVGWIANLTQHDTTPEQAEAGVFDAEIPWRKHLRDALTVDVLPYPEDIRHVSRNVAELASWCGALTGGKVMIGGAPWLMPVLVTDLRRAGYEPVFAFSQRRSEESKGIDGSVVKRTVFLHEGFVPALV